MKLSFTTLDVFTSTRYAGNPVAIIRVPAEESTTLTQSQKQSIAKEFNLSEIVFLHEQSTPSTTISIDIFTSIAEIPFAGHPTIGTAFYLLKHLYPSPEPIPETLLVKAGSIPISSTPNSAARVSASIPHNVHIHAVTHDLAIAPYGPCPTVSIVRGMTFILARLPTLETLVSVKAGIKPLQDVYNPTDLDEGWQAGVVGTYYYVLQERNDDGVLSVRTRMFGSREDPATGSAASALISWLSLKARTAGTERAFKYEVVQGVEMGRESRIGVEVMLRRKDDEVVVEEVILSGEAVEVMEGVLEV